MPSSIFKQLASHAMAHGTRFLIPRPRLQFQFVPIYQGMLWFTKCGAPQILKKTNKNTKRSRSKRDYKNEDLRPTTWDWRRLCKSFEHAEGTVRDQFSNKKKIEKVNKPIVIMVSRRQHHDVL